MKTIWTIVGVLVIIILIAMIYNKGKRNQIKNNLLSNLPKSSATQSAAPVTTRTEAAVVNPTPIVPIVIVNPIDVTYCASATYQTNLSALYDTYLSARAAYQAELNASGPNVIPLHTAMNVAYNAWWNERRKCVVRY